MFLGDVELMAASLKMQKIATIAVHQQKVYYLRTADTYETVLGEHLFHLLELETDRHGAHAFHMDMAVVVVCLYPLYLAVAYLNPVVVINGFYKETVRHHAGFLSCTCVFIPHKFIL